MRTGDRLRSRGRAYAGGQGQRLARFNGAAITHPALFGGGYRSALVGNREQTVAYGYAAVLEEFEAPGVGARWYTLSVSLPNPLPQLVIDHQCVAGAPDVPPASGVRVVTGMAEFDATYALTAADAEVADRLVTRELRAVLLRRPVQRVSFAGARLMLRSFDGPGGSPELAESLHVLAAETLAATPGFASRLRNAWLPFPPGICGPVV
ncbi:MAG: hypothetical protein QOE97_3293 [Pseudonocardiales bacterium]|jgi:hypothetical protein|nr:hypothetical protein [Pseudonocardiales bacterium]